MKDARRPRGASMIVLTLIIALLIVFVVGLFAFELNRVEVARAQLRSGTEAAALAAVTTLASQQSTNTMQAHTDAVAAALACFRRNEVLGTQLDGADADEPGIPQAYQAASNTPPDQPPVLKEASLFMEFLDPNSNPPNQVVPMGDDRGKAIRCYGNFHYQPAFSAFTGVGDTYLHCMSTGGVPDLDVVLCFDISGSIDDQTPVTLVKRYRKYAANGTGANAQFNGEGNTNTFGSRVDAVPVAQVSGVRYFVCNDPDGAQQNNGNTGKAIGSIYGLMDPPPTGTSFNGVAPQFLDQAGSGLQFDTTAATLRGLPNQGGLPANNTTPNNDEAGVSRFTDEVVNLDGNIIYGGYNYVGPPGNPTTAGNPPGPGGNFAFPNIPVLVEASRGNLDNAGVFASSGAQTAFQQLNINVTPQAGYKAAYDAQAFAMLKPIGDAKRAASLFYTLMNNNTKGHFGLVTFTNGVGSSPSSTWGPDDSIANNYSGDVQLPYPNPMVPLSSVISNTGYTSCINAIPNLVASQSTNINQSLITARTELTTHQRPNAKRAIVLFTDGQPTVGGDPRGGVCTQLASDGIPVYSIGLAQNTAIVSGEIDLLNDGGTGSNYTYTDPITGTPSNYTATTDGISKIASNGGKFYLVTNSANLGIIFGNIARSLCALVK